MCISGSDLFELLLRRWAPADSDPRIQKFRLVYFRLGFVPPWSGSLCAGKLGSSPPGPASLNATGSNLRVPDLHVCALIVPDLPLLGLRRYSPASSSEHVYSNFPVKSLRADSRVPVHGCVRSVHALAK